MQTPGSAASAANTSSVTGATTPSPTASSPTSPASSLSFDPASLNTISSGTLTVAYRTDDKPVSYIDNGKPAGFDVELEQAIADRLHMNTKFVSTTFAAMVPGVQNHQYDTAAFGVLATDKRKAQVDFTTPVGYGEAQLVAPKSAGMKAITDAEGKTIAITRGSALIPLLQKAAPGVNVKEFPNIASSTNALTAGQVDGIFTGNATAASLVEKNPDWTTSDTIVSGTDAMPVAKDRPQLEKALDAALASIMTDGTFTTLFEKWNPPGTPFPKQLYSDYPGMPHPSAAASGSSSAG